MYREATVLKSKIHHDKRGAHTKFFGATPELINVDGFSVKEIFMTTNRKNTLRGLHFQTPPQTKIIQVVSGSIIVNAVSCRKDDSLGKVFHNSSIAGDGKRFFIPGDWALGYRALEEGTKVLYFANEDFSGEGDTGVDPFDEALKINWLDTRNSKDSFTPKDAILSERDKELQSFEAFRASL